MESILQKQLGLVNISIGSIGLVNMYIYICIYLQLWVNRTIDFVNIAGVLANISIGLHEYNYTFGPQNPEKCRF